MIIHPSIPKRKKKKPNAKQKALKDSWQKLLEKYDVKPTVKENSKLLVTSTKLSDYRRTVFDGARSVDTRTGLASKKQVNQYTGDAMIGISVLHKSNGVPVFRQEDVVDISKMRRG